MRGLPSALTPAEQRPSLRPLALVIGLLAVLWLLALGLILVQIT